MDQCRHFAARAQDGHAPLVWGEDGALALRYAAIVAARSWSARSRSPCRLPRPPGPVRYEPHWVPIAKNFSHRWRGVLISTPLVYCASLSGTIPIYLVSAWAEILAAEGMEILVASSALNVVGGSDWLDRIGEVVGSYRKLVRTIRSRKADCAILLDLPDLNLRMAKKLHAAGVPVAYYISPQVWAWRRYQVGTPSGGWWTACWWCFRSRRSFIAI